MPADFALRLRAFAEVIVRVGLNLQRGQRLLIAEPYELQGVARSAEIIVEAVQTAAGCEVEVIWGDGPRLREYAAKGDWRGFTRLISAHARLMENYVRGGDALLFLQGSQPKLLDGIPTARVAELRRIGWEHFGPIARQLTHGATNWTAAPAPSPGWAHLVYAEQPSEQRLAALWDTVFEAMRIPRWSATSGRAQENPPGLLRQGFGAHAKPKQPAIALATAGGRVPPQDSLLAAWQTHLQTLRNFRDDLNARRFESVRYHGEGTDLTLALPPEHLWCTAELTTKSGLSFVANLPTEEVFTLPHRDSAEGTARVSRPINYGGAVIDGIELEFKCGRVVQSGAKAGGDLLKRMLDTDEGAGRLGEVAIVGAKARWASVSQPTTVADGDIGDHRSNRLFYHSLLDENVSNHIALGAAYAFCLRSSNPPALNRSLIHVDLPLDARLTLSELELP